MTIQVALLCTPNGIKRDTDYFNIVVKSLSCVRHNSLISVASSASLESVSVAQQIHLANALMSIETTLQSLGGLATTCQLLTELLSRCWLVKASLLETCACISLIGSRAPRILRCTAVVG